MSLKYEPPLADQLRASHASDPARGLPLNKRHWNTVTLDRSVADAMVRDLVEDSYDLVVSAMSRAPRAFGWAPDAA